MPCLTEQTARPTTEVEQESVIRLRLAAEAARTLARCPPIRDRLNGQPRSRRLAAIYYDTTDEALRQGGIALCLKLGNRQRTQIATTDGVRVAGILPNDAEPDPARIRDADLRARALHLTAGATVAPVFQVNGRLRLYPLTVEGAPVEMVVAAGQCSATGTAEAFTEAEFHAADRMAAFAMAEALAAEIAVSVERKGVVDRGYDLAHGRRFQAETAQDVSLDREWGVWRGFVAIMQNCLDQLAANESAFAAGGGSETIHQLRVAVRRMRAAFSAFSTALPQEEAADFKTELQWLQQIFGPARDWDVFCQETLPVLRSALPDHGVLRELEDEAHAARGQALVLAREALASPRHGLFQVRLERFLDRDGPEDGPLAAFAAGALAKRDRKLRRAGKSLNGSSAERLHDVRIAAKKVRYAAEFFRTLFGGKATRKYLRALRRIQDGLGAMNDANVARRLVATVRPDDREIAAVLDGWFAARVVTSRAEIGRLWEKFERAPRFWSD